jgi:hypothetical protein
MGTALHFAVVCVLGLVGGALVGVGSALATSAAAKKLVRAVRGRV